MLTAAAGAGADTTRNTTSATTGRRATITDSACTQGAPPAAPAPRAPPAPPGGCVPGDRDHLSHHPDWGHSVDILISLAGQLAEPQHQQQQPLVLKEFANFSTSKEFNSFVIIKSQFFIFPSIKELKAK